MKKTNKKGFTLIELLAVIIILGVLMLIAIPSVTGYITNSRKSAYITTADEYIRSVTAQVNSMAGLSLTDPSLGYLIKVSNKEEDLGCVKLESGGTTPFGDWRNAYVVVTYDGTGWTYFFTAIDSGGYGMDPVQQVNLSDSDEPTAAYATKGTKYTAKIATKREQLDAASNGNELTLPEIAGKAEEQAGDSGFAYIRLNTSLELGGKEFTDLVVIKNTKANGKCTYNPYS